MTGKKSDFNLSASIYKVDQLEEKGSPDIFNYMWLRSELAGEIESPGYYFSDDPGVGEALENLMLTQGWRKFKWSEVLDEKERSALIKYMPEYNGQLITGTVRDLRNSRPVPNAIALLSVQGHPFGFYSSKSDANGQVNFEVKNYYGNGLLIAQVDRQIDSFSKVEISSPFAAAYKPDSSLPHRFSPAESDDLLKRSINMQVQNIYSGDKLKTFYKESFTDTLPFFGSPDITYQLDNYRRFTTMEEVLREYVREVNVGNRKGNLSLRMFNAAAHTFYEGDVLVLLDGVPLFNTGQIFKYDPLKVRTLDIVENRYVLGPSIFNGVASFSTYDGSFDGFSLDPSLVAIDYDGLQMERQFYSPVYLTQEDVDRRLPDFRNTLFWAPDIRPDKNGQAILNFYTSDRRGIYKVVFEGMNDDGDFISGHSTFEVK